VVLAIEVVGTGSQTADRYEKPSQYAQVGIEHYWRMETDPDLVVSSFRLGDQARYVPTGVFKIGDIVNAPRSPATFPRLHPHRCGLHPWVCSPSHAHLPAGPSLHLNPPAPQQTSPSPLPATFS
jgi:hypothetical protein